MDKQLIQFPASSHSRRSSLRAVLREVVKNGAISRAELSRRTGLSKQTTSEIMRDLLEGDWVRTAGQQRGHVGRSATNYELNRNRAYVWGGDLGGTKLAIAISDLSGEILAEAVEPTASDGGEAVVEQIVSLLRSLAASRNIPFERIACGALGVPGSYDRRSGRLSHVSNISGLTGFSLEETLSKSLSMTVFVENDVTLAAKGELWLGNRRETGTFAFVAMGTGVGLGIVSDGQVVRGARGAAGEIAWLPLGGDPFDSRNFRAGTLEGTISSGALLQRFRSHGGAADADMIGLFDCFNRGEEAAVLVLDEAARTLAMAIVAIQAILDPEAVVFGGSIGARPELLALVRSNLRRCMAEPLLVEASQLGARAGLMGAVGMAVDYFHETIFHDDPALEPARSPDD